VCRVQGSGLVPSVYRVWGLGLGADVSGIRVVGVGVGVRRAWITRAGVCGRVWGLGFGVWGLGFGVCGLGLGFGTWDLGLRVQGLESWEWVLGSWV